MPHQSIVRIYLLYPNYYFIFPVSLFAFYFVERHSSFRLAFFILFWQFTHQKRRFSSPSNKTQGLEVNLYHWTWHDFEDQTEANNTSEDDPYDFSTGNKNFEYITRDFWAGSLRNGYRYTIGFLRMTGQSTLEGMVGTLVHDGNPVTLPDSGGWIVSFDLSEDRNEFEHVRLNHRASRELCAAVSSTIYDHYNISKAGIYCWYAARPRLLGLYDRALGFTVDVELKQKVIPLTTNYNRSGDTGRGYAIITQYYSYSNRRSDISRTGS